MIFRMGGLKDLFKIKLKEFVCLLGFCIVLKIGYKSDWTNNNTKCVILNC